MFSYKTLLIGGGATILALSATPMIMGFGMVGVGKGTVAAGIQSSIGGVVTSGSTFATLNSLGMKGIFIKGSIAGSGSLVAGTVSSVDQLGNKTKSLINHTIDGTKSLVNGIAKVFK